MILAEKMCFILGNPDVKNVGNPFDMKNRNIVWIVRNGPFIMCKAEVYGFIKGWFPGLSISLNIIIGECLGSFMQKSFTEYMGR